MKDFEKCLKLLQEILTVLKIKTAAVQETEVMTIEEVSSYVKVSKHTIYRWVARKLIPHRKKNSKSLYFLRSEIIAFIKSKK